MLELSVLYLESDLPLTLRVCDQLLQCVTRLYFVPVVSPPSDGTRLEDVELREVVEGRAARHPQLSRGPLRGGNDGLGWKR